MLWSERFVRDHKRQTDCAIHRASVQLASDRPAFTKFHELLGCARERSPRLFDAPILEGHHLGVDALINLSRFRAAHIRPSCDWAGTSSSWRNAVSLLADQLICRYKVPKFLSSSWYSYDSAGDEKRDWFISHSQGASFRSLKLPIAMTRRMEHLFLASQDHLPIEHAMRMAELSAMNASAELIGAVLSSDLGRDLRDGEFWRTVWVFIIANARDIEPMQIGPLIDFIQAVRRNERSKEPPHGAVGFNSPQPAFSMKGRTAQSMLRLMQDWHRSLGNGTAAFSWVKSPLEPMLFEEPNRDDAETPRRWQIMELTDSAQLRAEGMALHHCVASYGDRCYRGKSSIWSLRLWRDEKVHHVLTVEVDPKRRAIVQARGRANRTASGRPLSLLRVWAVRERLQFSV